VAYVLGELPDTDAATLEDHLRQGCARCAERVAWLRRVTDLMQGDDSTDPPPSVLSQAAAIFPRQSLPGRRHLLHKLVAALLFDSRHAQPAYGLRGGPAAERQLLFSAPGVDVDLHVRPGDGEGEFVLMGQVLTEEADLAQVAGAEVVLRRGRRQVLARRTDSLGEFAFSRLPPGQYSLRIRLPSQEIDLPGVDL
jgi:anti-sigma factor RsiW